MHKSKKLLKKLLTPVTIMLVPHTSRKSLSIRLPLLAIVTFSVICFGALSYVISSSIKTMEYNVMKEKLGYYSAQFLEMKSTMESLKKSEAEFLRLFSLNSKKKVLENIDTSDRGSLDMDSLKNQIKLTMETVGEIKDYLKIERDLYLSTPQGLPVRGGRITSHFGSRAHPRSGESQIHTGIDIAADPGNPVRATADGIVTFAGWNGANGNLAAIEHGFGFSTYYAHNKMLSVKVGQTVKRGDIVGYIGSTGNSTGPHVHYEIWRDGKPMNPAKYLESRS